MKVLITGANRGIGLSILEQFAKEGWEILALVRSLKKETRKLFDEIANINQVVIEPFEVDLADELSIKEFVKFVHKNKIGIDALVNNAGAAIGGTLMMSSISAIKDLFQVNFFGPLQLTQYVAKNMMQRKTGSIVNVCSIAALDGMNGFTAYGCSKAALVQATRIWASELSQYGIRVNAIAPAAVNTEMASQMDEKTREMMIGKSFMKRMSEPDEVAKIVFFLASQASSPINGQIIRIDGGM